MRCITDAKNWEFAPDEEIFYLDIQLLLIYRPSQGDKQMSADSQAMKAVPGDFLAIFFSLFIRVCPPLL